MKNPYRGITKENFKTVRDIFIQSIESPQPPSPSEIAQKIADETGMPIGLAMDIVQEEFIMAFEWNKNRDKS